MVKRRVCCFCERWASGGIEAFLYNLLGQIDLSEIEVDIVAARLEKSHFTAGLKARGVQFFELSGNLRDLPKNHRLFRLLLRQRQYDVVHAHIYQGLSLCYCRIARQEGVPVRIAHSHNEALRKSLTKPLKLLLHRWGRHRYAGDATALWACSEAAADFLFGPGSGFTFVPNGIDTAHFRFDPTLRHRLRQEQGLTDCLVLGNVGRLCHQKNQIFLLEIMAQLVEVYPNSRLLLIGDGDDREILAHRVKELGITDQVIFCGHTNRVAELLFAMDVFVLPSLFEGLPLAAVEAQAAGLPVLCSHRLSEEVKLTQKLVFMPLETGPKAWADKILDIADRSADRERDASTVASAGFEANAVAQRIAVVYSGRNDGKAQNFNYHSNL